MTSPGPPLLSSSTTADSLHPRQVQYLIERLYVRAGIRAQVPFGALSSTPRASFKTGLVEYSPSSRWATRSSAYRPTTRLADALVIR